MAVVGGCGTAVIAAEKLKRDWIGIDITRLAMTLIRNREQVWETREDNGDRYFVVSLRQIPGVCAWGRSEPGPEEHLVEAFEDYLTWRLEEGLPIPEPDRPTHEAERALMESGKLK